MSIHVCGAGMAFLGFTFSLFIGLWANNSFVTVVQRGLLVLILFYLLGCLLAGLGKKVILENFDAHVEKVRNPGDSDSTLETTEPESIDNQQSISSQTV